MKVKYPGDGKSGLIENARFGLCEWIPDSKLKKAPTELGTLLNQIVMMLILEFVICSYSFSDCFHVLHMDKDEPLLGDETYHFLRYTRSDE